jgi:hypothetical protein
MRVSYCDSVCDLLNVDGTLKATGPDSLCAQMIMVAQCRIHRGLVGAASLPFGPISPESPSTTVTKPDRGHAVDEPIAIGFVPPPTPNFLPTFLAPSPPKTRDSLSLQPQIKTPHSPRNIIRVELPPPLLTPFPHHPRPLDIKLPRAQEPQQVLVREPVVPGPRVDPFVRGAGRDQVLRFQDRAELGEGLLLCCIAADWPEGSARDHADFAPRESLQVTGVTGKGISGGRHGV